MILRWGAGRWLDQWVGGHLRRLARVGVGGQREPAATQDFESEVVATFGPFVGLLGQDCVDEADDGIPARERSLRRRCGSDLAAVAEAAGTPFMRQENHFDCKLHGLGTHGHHVRGLASAFHGAGELELGR